LRKKKEKNAKFNIDMNLYFSSTNLTLTRYWNQKLTTQ